MLVFNTRKLTGSADSEPTDEFVILDCNEIQYRLPPAAENPGRGIIVKLAAGREQCNVSAVGGDTIEGVETCYLSDTNVAVFISDGATNWLTH